MNEANNPIDWQELLRITNNRPALAKEMITMLGAELPEMKTDINQLVKKKKHRQLLDIVHKLHGSCCYCGVTRLKAITAKIEANLKQKNYNNLSTDLTTLNNEIDAILYYINNKQVDYE